MHLKHYQLHFNITVVNATDIDTIFLPGCRPGVCWVRVERKRPRPGNLLSLRFFPKLRNTNRNWGRFLRLPPRPKESNLPGKSSRKKSLRLKFKQEVLYLLKINKCLMNLTCFKNNTHLVIWSMGHVRKKKLWKFSWTFEIFFDIHTFSTLYCIFKELILVCQ